MVEGEREKLLKLEDELHKRVIGQDEAVEQAVSNAVIRARAGLKDENKPIGSFIFLGPTGVGKTELAKSISRIAYLTMSIILLELICQNIWKNIRFLGLIGPPPGYVGYEEGGQLTEAVKKTSILSNFI